MQHWQISLTIVALISTVLIAEDTALVIDAQLRLKHEVLVPAQVAGQIREVRIREGDAVYAGDMLVSLDDAVASQELVRTERAIESAELPITNDVNRRYAAASLEVNAAEYQKVLDANQRYAGTVSHSEVERRRLVVEQARLAIEQADFETEVARATLQEKVAESELAGVRLHQHRITSPSDGLVVEVLAQPGNWINVGEPVVRVIQTDPLRIEMSLAAAHYDPNLTGRQIEFSLPNALPSGETTFSGVITFVSPELHPVSGEFRVMGELPNPDRKLLPGMRGQVTILGPDAVKR